MDVLKLGEVERERERETRKFDVFIPEAKICTPHAINPCFCFECISSFWDFCSCFYFCSCSCSRFAFHDVAQGFDWRVAPVDAMIGFLQVISIGSWAALSQRDPSTHSLICCARVTAIWILTLNLSEVWIVTSIATWNGSSFDSCFCCEIEIGSGSWSDPRLLLPWPVFLQPVPFEVSRVS